jgi:hypothetical protein
LIDNDCPTGAEAGCGIIGVGDVLTGIVDWNKISPSNGTFGEGAVGNEFAGVFSVMVTSVTPLGGGESGFTFGPDPSFATTYTVPVGSMVALWDDPLRNLDRLTDGLGDPDATDGTLIWVWGFEGDPDEQWVAVGLDSPGAAAPSTAIATFNFQLSSLFEAPGLFPGGLGQVATGCFGSAFGLGILGRNPCLPLGGPADGNSLIDINGSGSVVAPEVAGLWPIYSNSDATFRPLAVPEPGTLTFLGAGLLAFGWLLRRRNAPKSST